MRIGVDLSIQELPEPTGVERAQATLLDALLAAPDDHEYVLIAPQRVPDRWREHPKVILAEGPTRPLWFWRESVVPGVVKTHGVDVLHSPVAAISLRARAHLLATIHEVPWAEGDGQEGGALGEQAASHRLRVQLAASFAHRLLCVSERTAAQVLRLYPDVEARVRVTPHGVDPLFSGAATGAATGAAGLAEGVSAPYVVAVGRLRHKKNLQRLLEAFASRVGAGGREQLVLVGPDGDAAETLRTRAAEPDLAGRVHFTGFVEDAVLARLLAGARALVHPSLLEGFGLPALEAMAVGVPVLASVEGAVDEATGGAAHRVAGQDVKALATGLSEVLDDEPLRTGLVTAGREQAATRTHEAAARTVLAVYEEFA